MQKSIFLGIVVVGILLFASTNGWAQNEAPNVDAGTDKTAWVGRYLDIGGLIVDDGAPDYKLSISWSKRSGPGAVSIRGSAKFVISGGIGGPPSGDMVVSMSTSAACFTNIGTYVLRLTANDMDLTSYDEVTITVAPAYGTEPLLSESFVATDMASLTSGVWTVDNNGSGNAWQLDGVTGFINSTCPISTTQDTWLISPAIDCSSHSNVCLELTESFWSGEPEHWSYGQVMGSTDGGTTWTAYTNELHSHPVSAPEEEITQHTAMLNMSWADGQSDVKMAWRHHANEDSWWQIDEVRVLGDLPGMIVPGEMNIESEETNHTVGIATQPGKIYTIEYTDQPLTDSELTWSTFADQSHGTGQYQETGELWSSFIFEDDMGPSTTGGEPVNGTRYYRIRIEDSDP